VVSPAGQADERLTASLTTLEFKRTDYTKPN
jgi:hypothetical protein